MRFTINNCLRQPYRSAGLIEPKPKPSHNRVVGCYLNYYPDATWREAPQSSVQQGASQAKLQRAIEKVGF